MKIVVEGEALISSASDGVVHSITAEELDWQVVGSDNRQMGVEVLHQADIIHPELGHLSWTISEYPTEMLNHVTHDTNGHFLLEDFDFSVRFEPEYDDLEFGEIGPPEFSTKELEEADSEHQKDMLVAWFSSRYQDPAHETPYNGREGGYQYINGGPFDAREELEHQFGTLVTELVIDSAVDEIESDGTIEWAPIRYVDDREDEDYYQSRSIADYRKMIEGGWEIAPSSPEARSAQKRVIENAEAFLAALRSARPRPGEIGHNGPPADDNGRILPPDFYDELEGAAEDIRRSLAASEPELETVARAGSMMERRLSWLIPTEVKSTSEDDIDSASKPSKFSEAFNQQMGKNTADFAFKVGATAIAVGGTFALNAVFPSLDLLVTSVLLYLGLRVK